jgi:hypothetical protein
MFASRPATMERSAALRWARPCGRSPRRSALLKARWHVTLKLGRLSRLGQTAHYWHRSRRCGGTHATVTIRSAGSLWHW